MFILRRVSGAGVEMNHDLGSDSYTLITKERNEEEFERSNKAFYGKGDPDEKVYGYVGNGDGKLIPLYSNQSNYIMTETGKTFSKL